MMRTVFSLAAAAAVSFGFVGGAAAQGDCQTTGQLASAVGSVMVDKGNGFAPGVIGTSLKTGDKVSVRGQGNAVVDFGDNRTVTIPSSTTETLRAPGCGFGLTNSGGMDPALGIAATIGAGIGLSAIVSSVDGSSNRTGGATVPVSP